MKKKLVSLALALAVCLSLSVPAMAAGTPTSEEALAKIEWTGTLTENSDFSPRDFDIPAEIHLQPVDETTADTLPKYSVTTADEVFTVKNLNTKNDGSYISVWGYGYTKGEDGVYFVDGVGYSLDMIKNRGLLFWEEGLEADDYVQLRAGESVSFKLPVKDGYGKPIDLENTLYNVKVGIYYPELEGGYFVESFFKIDPAAVNKVLSTPPSTDTPFADVAAASPYFDAIQWAVDQGITKGKTATRFGTNEHCTIKQILTFLYRSENKSGTTGNEAAAVKAWAQSKGIAVTEMDVPCTRSNAVYYIWKAAGSPAPKSTATFKDVPANAAYAKAMSWAVEKGITKGTTQTTFGPNDFCTRGQIVTFLYRAK